MLVCLQKSPNNVVISLCVYSHVAFIFFHKFTRTVGIYRIMWIWNVGNFSVTLHCVSCGALWILTTYMKHLNQEIAMNFLKSYLSFILTRHGVENTSILICEGSALNTHYSYFILANWLAFSCWGYSSELPIKYCS